MVGVARRLLFKRAKNCIGVEHISLAAAVGRFSRLESQRTSAAGCDGRCRSNKTNSCANVCATLYTQVYNVAH